MSEHRSPEKCRKRIRAFLAGREVVDSVDVQLVWEKRDYPQYWLPIDDVAMGELPPHVRALARFDGRLVRLPWDAMDAWFEEDEEVFVHARDPHKRMDILRSSRHVEVLFAGRKLAETCAPTMVFETGAPVRIYIPEADVKMDLLEPTPLRTGCAYKGFARYWRLAGVPGAQEIAWSYRAPFAEATKVRGLIAFYDDRVEVRASVGREQAGREIDARVA